MVSSRIIGGKKQNENLKLLVYLSKKNTKVSKQPSQAKMVEDFFLKDYLIAAL